MSGLRFLAAAMAAYLAVSTPATAEKRVALVIGNSGYQSASALVNPTNDATDVTTELKALGFDVILGIDLDKRGFDARIREFAKLLEGADTGLLFYAGHGLQVAGQNYLIPTDAKLDRERDLDFEAVRLEFILKQMEIEREGKTNLVILDACRDNPFTRNLARSMGTRSASIGRGLAQVQTGVGTFIVYSTQPGNVALDGTGRNSPFTAALVKRVKEPGQNLTTVMINVRKDVLESTSGRQVPWDHSALTAEFYFSLASAPQTMQKPAFGAEGNADAVRERLRNLEDELKRKSESADIATGAVLAQLKQRHRQLEDEVRRDRDRMFQLQRDQMRENNPDRRLSMTQEIFSIQTQMSRRGQDQRELATQIERVQQEMAIKK